MTGLCIGERESTPLGKYKSIGILLAQGRQRVAVGDRTGRGGARPVGFAFLSV